MSKAIECVRSGHAGGENNKVRFHWEKSFIFTQIGFIVLLPQHGRHEHTL